MLRTLEDLLATLGDRPIALCREMTKMHEQVVRTTLMQAVELYKNTPPKGEFALVIAGKTDAKIDEKPDVQDLLNEVGDVLERDECGLKAAVKQVADRFDVSKNELYQAALRVYGRDKSAKKESDGDR